MSKRSEEDKKEDDEDVAVVTKKAKPSIVSMDDFIEKRKALLEKEKELSRLRDEVSRQRQSLPWTLVTESYEFIGEGNKTFTLLDLFQESSQLIVQHFMFDPKWEAGCKSCSFMADHLTGAVPHLRAKDVSFVAIGRAPIEKLLAFSKRMDWNIPFYSSSQTSFNYDFKVAFKEDDFKEKKSIQYNYKDMPFFMQDLPGISVFTRENDQIYLTYSTFARGLDPFITTYQLLDLVPMGRNEGSGQYKMGWVKLHDEYAK